MDKLALELAKDMVKRSTQFWPKWDEVPNLVQESFLLMAKGDIEFLKSKGFRRVTEAKMPENPYQGDGFMGDITVAKSRAFWDTISGLKKLNPSGLFTEVKE